MALNFLNMPGEVRNQIYESLLLVEQPIDPFLFQTSAIGLFYTNVEIGRESIAFFYSQNCFDFSTGDYQNIVSFLEKIGQRNAGMIKSLYMDCPECPDFSSPDPNLAVLADRDREFLSQVQSYCPLLKNITLSISSISSMIYGLDSLDNLESVQRFLGLLDARFRAFTSLAKISIEVYEDESSDHITAEMVRQGWTVIKKEIEEYEIYRSLSDFGGSDHWNRSDHNSYDDADDYDIDNDSDFWRRAAD